MIPKTWLVVAAVLTSAPAWAEDKDKSGTLETWVVTKEGGELLGSESLRVVVKDAGNSFASGETKATLGKKKVHRKTHLQRGADGHIDKYQRAESGLKGAGVRVFEFEGQMRLAPLNAPGKPTVLGTLTTGRVWDVDLWHLFALWDLPSACDGTKKLAYFDPEKKATAEATLTCEGTREVYDAQKKAVSVSVWRVAGVSSEVELWVDGRGKLVGAKGKDRWMIKSKWVWAAGEKALGAGEGGGSDDEEVDRGIGE